jgi:NitT/TauT family transport system ATP-binding protein
MLRVRDLSRRFTRAGGGTVQAVESVSFDVPRGAFVSIIGPSGCGKSTLLRLIAGLDAPSAGSITIDGAPETRRFGFVFQEPVLLPWLTAIENVRFPLDMAGVDRAAATARAEALLDLVGLGGFEASLPHQLSGGMRQRTAIARALSYDPPILLMDEPFGALDLLTRDRLNEELLAIWERTGKTILFVTHSVEEAAYLSDTVLVMASGPGRLREVRPIDLPRPRGEATRLDPAFHALMAEFRRGLR